MHTQRQMYAMITIQRRRREREYMKIFKPILIMAGLLCVGIGTAGIFLPILPTTPFYLLAALCFAKCSARLHRWFTSTRLYKQHLKSFADNRAMTIKTKLGILIPVSLMLLLTALMVTVSIIRIVILVLLLLKYWYFIFMIRTIGPPASSVSSQ